MLLNISFHFDFFPLMIVLAIAWITPVLLSAFGLRKVPSVILEIILGFLLGHFFIEFDHQNLTILRFFALSGFVFLMFLSGLEIDMDQLIASLPRRRLTLATYLNNPLLIGISHFLMALIFSYFATLLLSQLTEIKSVWYFSLIMVTTSVGIILPVLKNRGEIHTRFGQMLITAAAVADIFSILLFTFTASILKNGFHFDLLLILALFVGIFISVLSLAKFLSWLLENEPVLLYAMYWTACSIALSLLGVCLNRFHFMYISVRCVLGSFFLFIGENVVHNIAVYLCCIAE